MEVIDPLRSAPLVAPRRAGVRRGRRAAVAGPRTVGVPRFATARSVLRAQPRARSAIKELDDARRHNPRQTGEPSR
eukprot:8645450-Lingulodinium_polyedra.AAC.1